jgi:hypothetical protein
MIATILSTTRAINKRDRETPRSGGSKTAADHQKALWKAPFLG